MTISAACIALACHGPAAANEPNAPEEVVSRVVDAYSRFDFRAFIDQFADDAEARTVDGSQVHRGKSKIRSLYRTNFQQRWPVVRIVESRTDGNHVILTEAYPQHDRELCCSVTEYVVENGKITAMILAMPDEWREIKREP